MVNVSLIVVAGRVLEKDGSSDEDSTFLSFRERSPGAGSH